MARRVRDSRLETREARSRLAKASQPLWKPIEEGVHLGYYKGPRGGAWWVRFYDGSRYHKQRFAIADDNQDSNGDTVQSYGEAQRRALELADSFKRPGAQVKPITVAEAAEHYLNWFRDHRKGVRETEIAIAAHILPCFGKKRVADLTTREIRAWLEQLAVQPRRQRTRSGTKQSFGKPPVTTDEKRARKSTANRVLTILKAMLNRAFNDELIADDLAWRRVRPFKNVDEPVVRFLTTDESQRLLNACTTDFRPLVAGALFTGARCGELVGLVAGDVNLGTETVFIRPSKSGRGRHVPLSSDGIAFFRSLLAGMTGDERVFSKIDGAPWGKNHHVRPLAVACEIAKIKPAIGFHDLRHSYASALAQEGVDLLTISKLLGHADTRITSRHYAHLCDRTLAAAVQKLPSLKVRSESTVISIR